MRRGCNDCTVGSGRPSFLARFRGHSGSTAPTMARSKQIVGATRQSRRGFPAFRRLCYKQDAAAKLTRPTWGRLKQGV
jgi:hypothetical protein